MEWYWWLFLIVAAVIAVGAIKFAFWPKTGQSK